MNLGVQLRVYRKSRGHSVQTVSQLTGISVDKIYKWEKGTRPSDAEDLLKIKAYLNGEIENELKTVEQKLESKQKETALDRFSQLAGTLPTVQEYIDELKKSRDMLYTLLNSSLAKLGENQLYLIAYQKAWVDYEAERAAAGDPGKKEEIKYKIHKSVDEQLHGDTSVGIQTGSGRQHKE